MVAGGETLTASTGSARAADPINEDWLINAIKMQHVRDMAHFE
jgi:hypothetical protein